MTRWVRLILLLVGLALVGTRGMMGASAPSGFAPITVDNATQVRLLDTLVSDNRSVSLNFSPDGTYVANYSKVWNLVSSAELPLSGAFPLAFSPDSSLLVISKTDSTSLLNLKTGEILDLLAEASVSAIFNSDGTNITLTSALDRLRRDCNITTAICTENPDTSQNTIASPNERIQAWLDSHGGTVLQFNSYDDAFAFSPDGSIIAIYRLRENKPVRLIDARTAEESVLNTEARKAIFSPDGKLIITAGSTIQFWSLDGTNATLISSLAGNSEVVLSPDGSTLANRLPGGVILIYGVPTPERLVQPLIIPGEIVPSSVNVRAEPSGEAEVVGLAEGNVLVGARSEQGDYVYLPDYAGWVRADSTYLQLAAGLAVDVLPVLNTAQAVVALATPTSLPPTPTITPIPTPSPTRTPSAFSLPPIGTPLVKPPSPIAGMQPITLSNLADMRLLGMLPVGVGDRWIQGTINSQGNKLLTIPSSAYLDRLIQVWDLTNLTKVNALENLGEGNRLVVTASADGALLAYSNGYSGEIHVFDVENTTESSVLPGREHGLVDHIAISPDKTMLAVSGYNVPSQVWDLTTNEPHFVIPSQDSPMVFTPDSKLIAVITQQAIRFFNTMTGELEYTITNANGPIRFSPDGTLLVAYTSTNKELQIRDVKTGDVRTRITYGNGYCCDLASLTFSPDGQFLAAMNGRDMLQLWDVQTGSLLAVLTAQQGGLAFSPDGTLLVTGNPFQIFDLTTGTIHLIDGGYGGQNPIFSPDGTTLLFGDGYSTMVFGIPDSTRPAWRPITGHIIPSGVNLRSSPERDADVIGYASGDVLISGRNSGGVYLPELGGWVWSDNDYLDLGDHTLADLPALALGR